MTETTLADLQAVFALPPPQRQAALDAWLNNQPDGDAAARQLAGLLASLDEPQRVSLLDAEKLRFPLGDAADRCSDPAIQSQLLVHASVSSLVRGELADLPYSYAKQAIEAHAANEAAWAALVESLRSDFTDFLGDLAGWVERARQGKIPPGLVKRTISGAQQVARDHGWSDSDLQQLEKLAAHLGS